MPPQLLSQQCNRGCMPSCLVLIAIVCVDMVRYKVQPRGFLYESYMKYGSSRKWRRNFHQFPLNVFTVTVCSHYFINKAKYACLLLHKKPDKKRHVLTEGELYEIGAGL